MCVCWLRVPLCVLSDGQVDGKSKSGGKAKGDEEEEVANASFSSQANRASFSLCDSHTRALSRMRCQSGKAVYSSSQVSRQIKSSYLQIRVAPSFALVVVGVVAVLCSQREALRARAAMKQSGANCRLQAIAPASSLCICLCPAKPLSQTTTTTTAAHFW